jgi:hypothetical protein
MPTSAALLWPAGALPAMSGGRSSGKEANNVGDGCRRGLFLLRCAVDIIGVERESGLSA